MKYFILIPLLFFDLFIACVVPSDDRSGNQPTRVFEEQFHNQWKGSQDHWRWEGEVLIGETTAENPLDQNSFLIWDERVEDFVLTIDFRISSSGNSGIYYRCQAGPEGYDGLLGYQADIDGQHKYTGIVYENYLDRHRKILANRGRFVQISKSDSIQTFPIAQSSDQSIPLPDSTGWHEYELIVKGPLIIQKLNGKLVSMVEDKADHRMKEGLFGFQLHMGPPMKVEFKNAIFRDLTY